MTLRLLVGYSANSSGVQTTLDYLSSLKSLSGFDTDYLHVTSGADIGCELDAYDAVFHNYCARLSVPGYMSRSYADKLRAFTGLKVAAVQDEYQNTNLLRENLRDLGFHVLLTCVPQQSAEIVYPKHLLPGLRLETVLTGYASSPDAPLLKYRPLPDRPITIGYRARRLSAHLGRLGFEKAEIGDRFAEICGVRGIRHDISLDENKRFSGREWFDFIGSCRVMLGSESGSNVFDWDGSLEAKVAELTKANGQPPTYQEFLPFIERRDGEVDMAQISPRVFECAALRTPMILFRGRYSDALTADEHYIPLEKDFSNIDHVLRSVEDLPALASMADRTYQHLIGSGLFGYKAFANRVQRLLSEELMGRAWPPRRIQAPSERDVPSADLAELVTIQFPTAVPLTPADMQRQRLIPNISVYLTEIERLSASLKDQHESTKAELLKLLTAADVDRNAIDENIAVFMNAVDAQANDYVNSYATKVFHAFEQLSELRADYALLQSGRISPDATDKAKALLSSTENMMETLRAAVVKQAADFGLLVRQTVQVLRLSECEKARNASDEARKSCLDDVATLQDLLDAASVSAELSAFDDRSAVTELTRIDAQIKEAQSLFVQLSLPILRSALDQEPVLTELENLTTSRLEQLAGESVRFNGCYALCRQSLLDLIQSATAAKLMGELRRLHQTCLDEARRLNQLCDEGNGQGFNEDLARLEHLATEQIKKLSPAEGVAQIQAEIAVFNKAYGNFCTNAQFLLDKKSLSSAEANFENVLKVCLDDAKRLQATYVKELQDLAQIDIEASQRLPVRAQPGELERLAQRARRDVKKCRADAEIPLPARVSIVSDMSRAFSGAYKAFNDAITSDLQDIGIARARAALFRLHHVCLKEAVRLTDVFFEELKRLSDLEPGAAGKISHLPPEQLSRLAVEQRQVVDVLELNLEISQDVQTASLAELSEVFNTAYAAYRDEALEAIAAVSSAIRALPSHSGTGND